MNANVNFCGVIILLRKLVELHYVMADLHGDKDCFHAMLSIQSKLKFVKCMAFLIRKVDYIKGGNGIVSGIKQLPSL